VITGIAIYLLAVGLAAACLYLFIAFHRIGVLQRELDAERKWHRDFRDEYRDHYWDMHRAVAAMGLKKMPGKGPEWVKEQQ
jgi:hypothetical protein